MLKVIVGIGDKDIAMHLEHAKKSLKVIGYYLNEQLINDMFLSLSWQMKVLTKEIIPRCLYFRALSMLLIISQFNDFLVL